MPFLGHSSEWGFKLLAEKLRVLQPLPQDAFCHSEKTPVPALWSTRSVQTGRGKRHGEAEGHGHGAAPWGNRDEQSGPRDVMLAGEGPGLEVPLLSTVLPISSSLQLLAAPSRC